MPNGHELQERVDFENSIEAMPHDKLIMKIAMMLYDHCVDQVDLAEEVKSNKARSWTNRILLLLLIATLMALGILTDVGIFHIL